MAITEDASTPAIIQQTGSGVSTTASFSPPSSSLLVALVSGGWGNTALMTAAVTDSTGGTWTTTATAAGTNTGLRGIAAVFYRYLPTTPGAMTVSVTFTGLQGGRELAVRVLNGAASSQAGGTGSQVNGTATTAGTVSVTTTVAGSVVYGIADNPNANNAYTPNAATSILTGTPTGSFADATDSVRLVAWKATNATVTPGATTLGGTWTAAANSNIAAFEVIPQTVTVFQGAVSLASISTLSANATVSGPPKVTMASVATFSVTPFTPPPPAFPNIPRVITVELFVNGGWTDISSDVYVRNSLVIKHGRADEQSRAAPSSCDLTIDNRSGNYSPRNPMGLYYGSLGRNTPIRVGVGQARDTFKRTVASGWGTNDTGQTYTVDAPTASVSGNQGRLSSPTPSSLCAVTLNGLSLFDVDVSALGVTIPFSVATGAAVIPIAIRLRRYSSSDYVYAWAQINTSGPVTAGINHITKGVIAASVSTGITFSAVVGLNIRAQVEGQTYRVKVWAGTDPEPYDWTTFGTSTVSMTPGSIGLQNRTLTGSTNPFPMVTTVTSVNVCVPRFSGEVSSWPQRWDLSGNDVYVPIEGSGIKRRLVQQAPFRSPLRRFHDLLTVAPPAQYWPCEDLKLSTSCVPVTGPADDVLLPNWNVPPTWVSGQLNDTWISFSDYGHYPGSSPIVTLPQRGQGIGLINTTPIPLSVELVPPGGIDPQTHTLLEVPEFFIAAPTGQVMLRFLMNISTGTPEAAADASTDYSNLAAVFLLNGSTVTYKLGITYKAGGLLAIASPDTGYSSGNFSVSGDIRDRDLLFSLQLTSSGSDATYSLTVLDTGASFGHVFNGTIPGASFTGAYLALVGDRDFNEIHVGHINIRLQNISTVNEIFRPFNAWSGPSIETAGARFSRLCTEENVTFYSRGDLTNTTIMGPQGTGSITGGVSNSASLTAVSTQNLLDLLYEVEDADLGMLYEPRGDIGLEYRTRKDLYSNQPTLALDYSLGHVAPPLEPVDDDQRTRNNVVVNQPQGQAAEAELINGPMSTLDPSLGGVGSYNAQYTINTSVDSLADLATFLLSLGTVDEARYPSITVDLANPNFVAAGLEPAALAVHLGDLITITNPKTGVTFDAIRQIVQGYTETLSVFQHTITFNTSPETPYRLAQVSGTPIYKVDAASATLAQDYSTTDVSLLVNNLNEPWTTDPAQMPLPITVAGELMSVTAVSGTSSPQTFTVIRSVNGVVKPQAAGASVQIARPQRAFIAF